MEMARVEIDVPKDIIPFVTVKDSAGQIKRNALLLYPYIENNTISHGRAAELLGMRKLDLIDTYCQMGLSYFHMDIEEITEDSETIKSLRGQKG